MTIYGATGSVLSDNQHTDGSSSKSVGFGVVQKFDAANLETYLVVRSYEYADTTDSYLDASSVLFGSRWKF